MNFEKIKKFGRRVYKKVLIPFGKKIKKGLKWTKDNILEPVWIKIKPAIIKAGKEIKRALIKLGKAIIVYVKNFIIDIIEKIRKANFEKQEYGKPKKIDLLKFILLGPKLGYDEWKTKRALADYTKKNKKTYYVFDDTVKDTFTVYEDGPSDVIDEEDDD